MRRIIHAALASVLGVTLAMVSGTLAYALWSSTATGKLTVSVASVVPNPPQNFRCTTTTNNSVSLAWSAVSNITEYRIYRRTGAPGAYTYSSGYATAPASATSLASVQRNTWNIAMGTQATLVIRAVGSTAPSLVESEDSSTVVTVTFNNDGGTCSPIGTP